MTCTIRVGTNGEYQVVPAEADAEVVELGQRFIDYEKSLPPGEQLPYPSGSEIAAALGVAPAGLADTRKEAGRSAVAATALHNAMTQAIPLLKEALEVLCFDGQVTNALDMGGKVKQVAATTPPVEPPEPAMP